MENSNIQLARLAEQAERYDDMVKYMKEVAVSEAMGAEERNLFSVAYKNVVGTRRSAWRILSSLENKEDETGKELCKTYRDEIEKELKKICQEVVALLDDHVLPNIQKSDFEDDQKEETRVFFEKMKGDYYRYMAEALSGDDKDECADKAKEAYEHAHKNTLDELNPVRLGLALNFSVFYYEILKKPEMATELAQKAFDEAVPKLESDDNSKNKDATLILQLLRDNLTLWSGDPDDDNN